MRTATVLLIAALSLGAQAPVKTPAALSPGAEAPVKAPIAQIRAHMLDTLVRQPNYTCLETVERAIRTSKDKDFRMQDVLKLEVALVGGKEMLAWPGSKHFDDTDISTFAPTGMFGNGDFGLYERAVFAAKSTEIQFHGDANLGQGPATQYDFTVQPDAGMRIRAADAMAMVGFHGSFYAEAGTLDVLRLDVIAGALPRSMDLREVTDTLEYARVPIGAENFLLPSGSEQVMTDLKGDASRNRVKFTGCREFAGESTLKFGGDEAETDVSSLARPATKQEIKLPKNAELTLRLLDEIDTDKLIIGDVVRAVLDADLKLKGQVLLPKGTATTGRIVRVERQSDFTVMGLIFQEAESDMARANLELTFDSATGAYAPGPGKRIGTRSPARPHEGFVLLGPGRWRGGRGILLHWRT